ncbi:hypothetical protein [Streptomyces sp. NPDC058335]|uniref:hypothetical protein n=1 Tax=Streptomyces sp. NPDC058335 TaxID=3346451 RepID=UPI00366965D1
MHVRIAAERPRSSGAESGEVGDSESSGSVPDRPLPAMKIVGLDHVIDTYPTLEAALRT